MFNNFIVINNKFIPVIETLLDFVRAIQYSYSLLCVIKSTCYSNQIAVTNFKNRSIVNKTGLKGDINHLFL